MAPLHRSSSFLAASLAAWNSKTLIVFIHITRFAGEVQETLPRAENLYSTARVNTTIHTSKYYWWDKVQQNISRGAITVVADYPKLAQFNTGRKVWIRNQYHTSCIRHQAWFNADCCVLSKFLVRCLKIACTLSWGACRIWWADDAQYDKTSLTHLQYWADCSHSIYKLFKFWGCDIIDGWQMISAQYNFCTHPQHLSRQWKHSQYNIST